MESETGILVGVYVTFSYQFYYNHLSPTFIRDMIPF